MHEVGKIQKQAIGGGGGTIIVYQTVNRLTDCKVISYRSKIYGWKSLTL